MYRKPQLRFYCSEFGYVAISVTKGAQFFFNRGARDRGICMCQTCTNFTLLEIVKKNLLAHFRTETKECLLAYGFL